MLRMKIIVIDRTRTSFLREGESLYLARLRKYCQVEWIDVKPVKIKKGRPVEDILGQEGKAVLQKVIPGDYVAALDRTGKTYDSIGFSRWLDRLSVEVSGSVCFVIGGPMGLSKEVLEFAQTTFSLSRLTFTHEMTRLILIEQVYRAMSILRGEKYHK